MSATLQPHTFEIPTADFKQCSRKRFYFEDELTHNMNKRVKVPSYSVNNFPPSTLPFSTFRSYGRDEKLSSFKSNNIVLNKNGLVSDSHSKMSRIIDLSTGESLESISNSDQNDRQKLKRPLELVENDYKSSVEDLNIERDTYLDVTNETIIGNNHHKKIRTSEKPTVNYIEDVEDVDDGSRLINNNNTVGIIQEFKNPITSRPISSTSIVTIDPTNSLPLVVKDKNSRTIEFTPQYQKAFNKYMRSQFDTVNDYSVLGKEMILYRQNNDGYIIKDDNSDGYTTDSEGKIVEIEEDDIQMLDNDDVGLLLNEGAQNLDVDDKMDIDE
ncbi:16599_t:CDS:1 [Gigaspora margarita]|uniref:16599_t:CDS:1 n=1 Tax=Gigaspora margarita TaxID=4874 RepID=A0ABN7VEQ5_GIGMA|nr:16599_t:CDS:1 [Gigaspora margarita]